LKLIQEFHDPLSVRQLDLMGVGEGWRCLDAGAGGGSLTRLLAERVGSTGTVLAVDIDTSLLDDLADERIEVRRVDVLDDPLPQDVFDLAYARLLLMHLPSRVRALTRLSRSVRPGGWVAAMDPDFGTIAISPSSPTWERTRSVFLDSLISGGWDPSYGARLARDQRAAGLVDVRCEQVASEGPGGSLIARILSLTVERLRDRMLALGASNEEIDEARRLLEDPASTFRSQTTYLAHGRRPA
jgi:SAM-dependent methyltransferase